MVILGVLIVFWALKMRARHETDLFQLNNAFNLATASPHFQPAGRRQVTQFNHLPPSLPHIRRPMTTTPTTTNEIVSVESATRIVDANGQSIERHRFNRRSFRCMPGAELTSPLMIQSPVAAQVVEPTSTPTPLLINTAFEWTPRQCVDYDDDYYYNDERTRAHETATLEAALSLVLTAATLAGFRPSHERACCLHHTVQVSFLFSFHI